MDPTPPVRITRRPDRAEADYAQDDEDTEQAVHLRAPDGTLCGEEGEDTAGTGHVTCDACKEELRYEGERIAAGITLCSVCDEDEDFCDCTWDAGTGDDEDSEDDEEEPTRTPYDADHVAYVHEAGEVHALYIPNLEQAKDPKGTWAKCRDIAWWRSSGVEAIGSIVPDGPRWWWEGSADLDPFPDGDPTTKREAMQGLRKAVAKHFETSAD